MSLLALPFPILLWDRTFGRFTNDVSLNLIRVLMGSHGHVMDLFGLQDVDRVNEPTPFTCSQVHNVFLPSFFP